MKKYVMSKSISNWDDVQKYYDEPHTLKETEIFFEISNYCMSQAIKLGLIKPRKTTDFTTEIRNKISKSMKVAHAEGHHPGWLSVNLNKKMRTYPEQYFLDSINSSNLFNNVTILEKVQFKKYVFDFVVVEAKIDIEIDGGHHSNDAYTIEKDIKRDMLAKESGWRVFRISWVELKNKKEEILKELAKFIEENISSEKYEITKISVEKEEDGIKNYRAANFCIGKPRPLPKYGKREDYNKFRHEHYVPNVDGRKVVRPSKEELEKMVWEIPTIQLKKKFGVSDVAIAKWCKMYGINKPPRGYWMKQQARNKENIPVYPLATNQLKG